MKTIKLLKTCINIYYYLMLISFVFGLITLPILLFTQASFEINMLGSGTIDLGLLNVYENLLIITVMVIVFGIYFMAIRLIKLTVDAMSTGDYFSSYVITNFKKIGKFFLFCAFGFSILESIVKIIVYNKFTIGINSVFALFLIIGLFLTFLSEVFKIAKAAKEENELTV
ncbi:MAG: hypothetical protein CMC76_05635 [Flavobacteriaceae bacterium]|nr:hypothetical protein [Flavobacteriaceae bacterium]